MAIFNINVWIVAQLAECLFCKQEAVGSKPTFSIYGLLFKRLERGAHDTFVEVRIFLGLIVEKKHLYFNLKAFLD